MKQSSIAILIALGVIVLAGLAAVNALQETKIPGKDVIVLGNAFVAVEATATNYLKLPLCRTHAHACREPAISVAIVRDIKAARMAVLALETDAKRSPSHDASVTLFQAAGAAIGAAKISIIQTKAPHGNDHRSPRVADSNAPASEAVWRL